MKNKRQITVLVSVPVTLEYDSKKLTEAEIKTEVAGAIRGVVDDIWWFPEQEEKGVDCVFVHETSVRVDDIIPTNYKYNG